MIMVVGDLGEMQEKGSARGGRYINLLNDARDSRGDKTRHMEMETKQ